MPLDQQAGASQPSNSTSIDTSAAQQQGTTQQVAQSASPPPDLSSQQGSQVAADQGAQQQQQATNWTSIRDYGREAGVDLSQFQDDSQAMQALLSAYRTAPQIQQLQHLARYGNEYLQHREAFENFRRGAQPQSSTPGLGASQAQKSWWSPPCSQQEAQSLMQQWSVRDAQGNVNLRPDAPPSVVEKINGYAAYVQDWENKLRHNPQEAFGQAIRTEAEKIVNERLTQNQQMDQAKAILGRNAGWMFYQDQNGQPMPGNYTPHGQAFYNYVRQLEAQGVRDPQFTEYWALSMLQGDMYRQQAAAAARNQQPQQAPQGQPRMPGVMPVPQGQPQNRVNYTTPQNQGITQGAGTFESMLRDGMAQAGIRNLGWDSN